MYYFLNMLEFFFVLVELLIFVFYFFIGYFVGYFEVKLIEKEDFKYYDLEDMIF